VTSSSDDKLERAKSLGADYGVHYVRTPDWENAVLALTQLGTLLHGSFDPVEK
jgi:NADPH:quinone reductase-like Zn-dependent oxidoreductase